MKFSGVLKMMHNGIKVVACKTQFSYKKKQENKMNKARTKNNNKKRKPEKREKKLWKMEKYDTGKRPEDIFFSMKRFSASEYFV